MRIENRSGEIISRNMSKGCPQGSIFGLVTWNMVLDGLLESHNNEGNMDSIDIAYADDVAVMVSGDSRKQLEETANREMQRLGKWCEDNGLEVSAQKTFAMMLKGDLDKYRRQK